MRKPYLCRKKIRGKERWFVRRYHNGRESYVEIKAEPGTPQFDAEYWDIIQARHKKTPSRTSWGNLIKEYRASPQFKRLKPQTKQRYELNFSRILDKNADKDIRATSRQAIRAFHAAYSETPAQADKLVIIFRLLLNFARVELEWIDRNVAEGIELHGPTTRTEAWPQEAQKRFLNGCESLGEDNARTMFMLGIGTGQRAGDLLAMEWAHYDGEYIRLVQEKTGTRLTVYCPARLREYLDALPRTGKHILARNLTEPLTYSQAHKAVMRVRKATGLEGYRIHGWRATAAVELREAGNDLADIAAITGHKDLAMVQHYTRDVDQKAMSKKAQEKRR